MSAKPQTWHYGLVAKYWAEFNVEGPEIVYFQKLIECYGQPALDVACGTGRLLLPYLRAGLDVDGCDVSPDMLALCREKAEREGFAPRLYVQAMHELNLPRKYKTIVVCGAFGLGSDRQQDLETLRRFYQHLEPGGALVLDEYLPYRDAKEWQYWVKEKRDQLPEPWPPPKPGKRAADGAEYKLRGRVVALDPLEQVMTRQIHAELWREGLLVAQEERILHERYYFKHELLMMLGQAGFGDVQVQGVTRWGDHMEAEATAEHGILVFISRK